MPWKAKHLVTALLVLVLGLGVTLALALPARAEPLRATYNRARNDYKWLMTHPEAKEVYRNWQTLADLFSQVYKGDPTGPLADKALFWKGRVAHGSYRQFKRKTDFNEALDLYRRLINHFPKSRLADDGQMVIAQMYEDEGDLQQAYLEYLRVTVNYPQGDQVPAAKKKLDALERKLAPTLVKQHKEHENERPAPNNVAPSDSHSLANVEELRHWSTPTYTRVVLSLERPVPYTANLLKRDVSEGKPRRLYLDLRGARLTTAVKDVVPIDDGLLRQARAGQFTDNTVRLVLDIKQLESYKVFTLDNPFRVVIDCFGPTAAVARSTKPLSIRGKSKVPRGRAKDVPPDLGLAAALGLKIRRVILDPGHGGRDPGALYRGVKEKDLTLDLAQRAAPELRKLLGCEVLLTRDRDVFLPLETRTALANTKEADLFVSIHINASPNRRLSGIETYFLNLATDEESMRVAARENATTTRSISDLQVILNDLMLNSKINESNRLARSVHSGVLGTVRRKYRVQDLKVKQAPFYVLIGARMPAILVEVGFITNSTEYRRLKSGTYRDLLAKGIAKGVADYARQLNSGG